ncbi:MAG: hypothetical protein LBU17_01600 [Treponema sp.]|nr:hypothetical protein [Treponema sp.]
MRTIITRCGFGVLVFFMLTIFARFFTQNVLLERLHMDNGFVRAILYFDRPSYQQGMVILDWAEMYPFKGAKQRDDPEGNTNTLDRFNDVIITLEEKINAYTTDVLIAYTQFAEKASKIEWLLGWNLHETIVDLGGGYLVEPVGKFDAMPSVRKFAEFNNFLAGLQIDLLYVQCPNKICRYDTIPAGIANFFNQNADEFLAGLSSYQIPYLDLREAIHAGGFDHHSLLYRTDNHWKSETGLWAAGKLAEYLNTRNGFMIDLSVFDPDSYRYDVYANWYLGGYARKLTLARAAPEDFTLIYPEFDTDFSIQMPSWGIDTRGTFDVFYWKEQVSKVDYYNLSPYYAYFHSFNAVASIHNNVLQSGKKILFINDSFGWTFIPFFACGVENIDSIDLRNFTGSVRSYIEQTKPDMVIVMYNTGFQSKTEQSFNFR